MDPTPTHVPGADRRVLATASGGAAPQALRILAAGLAAALLLGATPLRQWADSLAAPPTVAAPIAAAAAPWARTTARLGLDRPYDALRATIRRLEAG